MPGRRAGRWYVISYELLNMMRPREWEVSTRWMEESTSGYSFPAWTITGEAGGHQSTLSLEMPPVFRADQHALDGFAVLC